jgi:hypothetical protein
MAYHHFKNIDVVTKVRAIVLELWKRSNQNNSSSTPGLPQTLTYHLKPGGRLMVVDLILDPSLPKFWSDSYQEGGHGDHHHQHAGEHVHKEARHEHDEQHHHELSRRGVATPHEGDSTDPNSFPVPPKNVVAHKGGFNRERIEEVFRQAGLCEFEWNTVGEFEPVRGRNVVELFLATGVAP